MRYSVASIIIVCFMLLILLSACQPKIPRTKCKSFDDMVKSLPFQIVFPESNPNLYSGEYDVEYFFTCVPGSYKPIKTGYSIELKATTHAQNDFRHLEYRGIDLKRENGRWTMFDKRNYTCVKPETVYETQGQTMFYAEYRPYPFTTNEISEQKGISLQPSFVDELENEIFTIFHAYIDVGDLRYSITLYDVDECTAENIESKCLEEAVCYFKELFTTKEAIADAPESQIRTE